MHGSNQYSNPPAPEWRVPAAPQRQSGQPGVPSPPPPPPPPPSYNSNSVHGPSYGHPSGTAAPNAPPISGVSGFNTATWGVNYNRHNYIQTPPPLPPRPSSSTGQPSNVQSPIVSTADPYQPSIGAPSYGGQVSYGDYHQQWPMNPPYVSQQPVTSLPSPLPVVDAPTYQYAPPPPTPLQTQQAWHQLPPTSYPTVPPSQYHPPITVPSQPSPPPPPPPTHPGPSFSPQVHTQPIVSTPPERPVSQSSAPTHLPAFAPPVPPKASPLIIPTGSSALGFGGPSDWEHFSPIAGEVDDVNVFKPRSDHPAAVHELPPSHQAATSDVALNNHSLTPSLSNPTFTNQAVTPEPPQFYQQQSPISPGTRQDFHPLPHPIRVDSTGSDYSTVSAVANSESIDGLIEAWNQPISVDNKPLLVQQSDKVEPEPVSPQRSPSPPAILPPKQAEPTTSEETVIEVDRVQNAVNEPARRAEPAQPPSRPVDRYEDLDSWSQSSLERYVAMLRKEAVADLDEERFKIFTTFMAKETKLREILYSIEHESKSNTTSIVEASQQPAAPQTETKEPGEGNSPPAESGLIPVESEDGYFANIGNLDDVEDGSYSPGGRPIIPRLHTPALHRSPSNPGGHKYSASHAISGHTLRSTSVPPLMNNEVPKTALSPLTTNPPQRLYTPFRYTKGPQRGSDKLTFGRPAYQAYSALRQASAESGRVMAEAPTENNRKRSSSAASMHKDQDEAFVGLIREKSVSYRKKPLQTSSPPPLPASLRQGKPPGPIEDLRTVVSSSGNKQSESLWHMTVRRDLEKYPNDFGFIRETFKPWEAAIKVRKENLDTERIKRQEESENQIDALFNGKEIGYADINILEEEFRQTEARTQLEEERLELEGFISDVFNVVDERLEEEISTIQVLYDSALSQLDRENSKEDGSDKHSMSHTMKIVNEVHHKLEMRHHKRLEIALDRERRRKKAERRPLVFMGDSAALKKLDNEFDQMEKQNILEAARSRDERANKLMDLFDDAIMRGLGENQTLLDELSAKVVRVDEAAIRSSGLPDAEIEHVLKSMHSLVESLQKDSESTLHSFGVADSALNNADYSVSVAEARYSNSEPDVFRQLEAEKKKEDAKIQDNLRTKLQSVRVGPTNITASINEALRTLGKTPFPKQPIPSDVIPDSHLYDVSLPNPARPASSTGVASRKTDSDPEHRERLRKALEDAKKRNAARRRSPSAVSKE